MSVSCVKTGQKRNFEKKRGGKYVEKYVHKGRGVWVNMYMCVPGGGGQIFAKILLAKLF